MFFRSNNDAIIFGAEQVVIFKKIFQEFGKYINVLRKIEYKVNCRV